MSDALETLKAILSEKLPDDQVQALMAELTIASGNGAVAIAGDATEAVIITGSQNIVGDNNQVVINQNVTREQLTELLRSIEDKRNTSRNTTDPKIEAYRRNAIDLISNSYRRNREIDSDCIKNLEKLRRRTDLSREQADRINNEFLQLCSTEYQNLEEFYKEAEQLIRRNSTLSNDVLNQLHDKEIAYRVDKRAKAQFFNMIGCKFIREGEYERAKSCLQKAIGIEVNDPNIYANLATLHIKCDNLSSALELLRRAEKLYTDQRFPDQTINNIRDAIRQIEQKRKKSFFPKLFN